MANWPVAGHDWLQGRAGDLQDAWQILKTSVEQRSLPSASDLSPSLLLTSFAALLLPQVLFVLASKKGRKFVFDSLETVIASLLVLILLSIVLGLPIGAVYLMLKAVSYFVSSLLSLPSVQTAVASLQSRLFS